MIGVNPDKIRVDRFGVLSLENLDRLEIVVEGVGGCRTVRSTAVFGVVRVAGGFSAMTTPRMGGVEILACQADLFHFVLTSTFSKLLNRVILFFLISLFVFFWDCLFFVSGI